MYMDLVILLIMLCGSTFFLPTLFNEMQNPAVRCYEDKTALDVTSVIEMDSDIAEIDVNTQKVHYKYSGGQLALMLLVQDQYAQSPYKVRIGNNYYVTFNAAYVADKYQIMNNDYDTYIKPLVNKKTIKVDYVFPEASNPGVTDSYFWFQFQ